MERIEILSRDDWVPDDRDLVMHRARTTGVIEEIVTFDGSQSLLLLIIDHRTLIFMQMFESSMLAGNVRNVANGWASFTTLTSLSLLSLYQVWMRQF